MNTPRGMGAWLARGALLAALVVGLLAPPGRAMGQDVLIWRPLENSAPEVSTPTHVFAVMVSAFEDVTEVHINGEKMEVAPAPMVQVKKLLPLVPGANRITVQARSGEETAEKVFELVYRRERKHRKPKDERKALSFQLFSMLAFSAESNPLKLPQGAIAGNRTQLILLPRLDYYPGKSADSLRVQGVISREHFDREVLKGEEVALTQISLSWIDGLESGDEWTSGGGISLIDQENKALPLADYRAETDVFLFSDYKLRLDEKFTYLSMGLEWKLREVVYEPRKDLGAAGRHRDEDATVMSFRMEFLNHFSEVKSRLKVSLENNNAQGKYKDRSIYRLSEELSLALLSFQMGGGLRLHINRYLERDPDFGNVAPHETRLAWFLNGAYLITPAWLLSGELRTETQRSNVPASEYENQVIMLGVMHVY